MNRQRSLIRAHSLQSLRGAAVLLLAVAAARGENWPQWRGPRGDGVSSEQQVPIEWSTTKNVAWKRAITGEGHSSPIVWENSVFVTTARKETNERLLLRIDAATGDLLWERVVLRADIESMHRENSAASSTPVTDGKYIFTSFQNGPRVNVQCYDYSGNQLWAVQPLSFEGMHGYSYTPVLYKDLVILDFSQNDDSAVVALDKQTGNLRWKHQRRRQEISHVAPLLVYTAGKIQLIVCGGDEIRSFNPETGESYWWCQGPTEVCVAGLSLGKDTVFANGGYPKKTRMAVRTSGRGDVTETGILWKTFREVSYVPSPVYHQGYLYTVLDDGMLHCFEAATGQSLWEERLAGRYRSSLLLAGPHIYATNDQGQTTVFLAKPDRFQSVTRNDLNEFCYSTPAIANGRLFIRTGAHLYCLAREGLRAGPKSEPSSHPAQ